MKVEQVVITGFADIRSLSPLTYTATKAEFESEGIKLPTEDQLELDTRSNYWVLLKPVTVNVKWNSKWHTFEFKRGFVYDLASTPRIIRGVCDDNDQTVLYAAMVHDACFTSHCVDFHTANELLRSIMIHCGSSKIKARIFWLGVSSPVGRFLYNKKTIKRATWQLKSFTYSE